MRKRWSPWRAAAWGAGVGVITALVGLASPGSASAPDAQMLGQFTGSILAGSVLFLLVAAIRNWAVRAPH
jgi:hypothetical protein